MAYTNYNVAHRGRFSEGNHRYLRPKVTKRNQPYNPFMQRNKEYNDSAKVMTAFASSCLTKMPEACVDWAKLSDHGTSNSQQLCRYNFKEVRSTSSLKVGLVVLLLLGLAKVTAATDPLETRSPTYYEPHEMPCLQLRAAVMEDPYNESARKDLVDFGCRKSIFLRMPPEVISPLQGIVKCLVKFNDLEFSKYTPEQKEADYNQLIEVSNTAIQTAINTSSAHLLYSALLEITVRTRTHLQEEQVNSNVYERDIFSLDTLDTVWTHLVEELIKNKLYNLAEHITSASEGSQRSISRDMWRPYLVYKLASAYRSSEGDERVVKFLRAVILAEEDPEQHMISKDAWLPNLIEKLALDYISQGSFDRALAFLHRIYQIYPQDKLGLLIEQLEKYPQVDQELNSTGEFAAQEHNHTSSAF